MNLPKWATQDVLDVVRVRSETYRLDLSMVIATIETESAGNPLAMRAEANKTLSEAGNVVFVSRWRYFEEPDHFADLLNNPPCSRPTEWVLQSCGLGPMQVQGSVAREHGFDGWLTELLSWGVGVEFGCRHLRKKADRYGDDPAKLYASYNGGSPVLLGNGMFRNQRNVDHFMQNYRRIRG